MTFYVFSCCTRFLKHW